MVFKGSISNGRKQIWVEDDDYTHILLHQRPVGFNWGGNGEESFNTALSILSEFIPPHIAVRHAQAFEEHFVDKYPDEWAVAGEEVFTWLAKRMAVVGDDSLDDGDMATLYPVVAQARKEAEVEIVVI